MLFNSYSFLLFLAVVLIVSRQVPSWTLRKTLLLAASYLFYAAWNPPFVILLWISTAADWHIARWIHRSTSRIGRRWLLVASLSVNLGMLFVFKYGEFALANLWQLLGFMGLHGDRPTLDIILPVGISFYTFQTLSYTIDVYRERLKPGRSFLDYALYVTFFPQLVAGPIVRAGHFLPQCESPKKATAEQLGWGASLFVVGLFNKVVIADTFMAPVVEAVYSSAGEIGFVDAWCGTFAFAVQIFCDFAGYSSCAIGLALCLGFELPDNFRSPYAAVGFSDFWSRWHISLSSWLRDYLYIPLGGSREGRFRTYVNLMITMLLGGLWHGASWLFVIWGGLHGLFLIAERLLTGLTRGVRILRNGSVRFALALVTFLLTCTTWVFFRSATLEGALSLLRAMVEWPEPPAQILSREALITVAFTGAMLAIHWAMRNHSLEEVKGRLPWWGRSVLLSIMIVLVLMSLTGQDNAFIYFQF